MTFSARPATAIEMRDLTDLVIRANASLVEDGGVPANDPSLLMLDSDGHEVVERDGMVWISISDAASMPWRGWIANEPSSANGLAMTDADVTDPAVDPLA